MRAPDNGRRVGNSSHRDLGPGALTPISTVARGAVAHLTAPQTRLLSYPQDDPVQGILYQHSMLCQMSMPYRNPGDENRRWRRKNGYLTFELDAGRAFDETAR